MAHAASMTEPQGVFAIVIDELVAGGIGVHRLDKDPVYRDTAELGYWLAEPYWGRGLMTEAVRAVTRYAFDELGLFRIEAGSLAGTSRRCGCWKRPATRSRAAAQAGLQRWSAGRCAAVFAPAYG